MFIRKIGIVIQLLQTFCLHFSWENKIVDLTKEIYESITPE